MSFAPALPLTGYAGWAFLKRTMVAQTKAFDADPVNKREEAYFREKIGSVKTAEQLVGDRRLLRIALGAFGLEGDINNRYFIRKVLEDGTLSTGALSSKLADKQYEKLSATFGFGDFSTPSTQLSDFADKILSAYKNHGFEVAVGEQNSDLRLALNASRELPVLAAKTTASADTKWYTILGNAPLRSVFQKALGLPTSFAALDLDKQLVMIKAKAESQLGSSDVAQFADAAKVEGLVKRYLLRSEVDSALTATSSSATALSLVSQLNSRMRASRSG